MPGSPTRTMPAAAKGGSPARKKPQGGSPARKKPQGGSPARKKPQGGSSKKGKAKASTTSKNRSEVINEKLAGGFKNQIGFDHFKTDWKKKVAEKYKKEGAWIPKKVGNEFHYIFDDKDKNPAVVTAAEAKDWHNHVKAIAEKLDYELTNGMELYDEGKLTLFEYSALPDVNKTTKQFWQMADGHCKAKSKWTSNMVKILSEDLREEVNKKAPFVKRGAQPHRSVVIGERNIVLVDVDEDGNLMDIVKDDEDEDKEDSDDEAEAEDETETKSQAVTEEEAEPANEIYEQFINAKKSVIVALYLEITGHDEDPKGTAKALRQDLIDSHLNLEQLKMIATGAGISGVNRIKKEDTLRAKIIEKLADGKILPVPAASPAASPKKRKAESETEAAPAARKSSRRRR